MQTLQQTHNPTYLPLAQKKSPVAQFMLWCKNQEPNRFAWLAVIIALHGCVLIPVTVLLVTLGGNGIEFGIIAISAMAIALVTNLAAMPTKITIPVFFFSVLIDVIVMGISLYNVFSR